MSPAQIVIWLGWACYAGALAAIVVYVIHFAGRQGWKRPWNAAGLFFTAIALTQAPPLFLSGAYDHAQLGRAAAVTVCLLIATGLQAFTALRRRRRAGDAAPSAEPPTPGPKA